MASAVHSPQVNLLLREEQRGNSQAVLWAAEIGSAADMQRRLSALALRVDRCFVLQKKIDQVHVAAKSLCPLDQCSNNR